MPDNVVRARARVLFLCAVDEVEPAVKVTLYRIQDISAELETWAESWQLQATWCLDYARATLDDHLRFGIRPKHQYWSDYAGDAPGWFEGDAPARLERHNRLRDPAHFQWLARAIVRRESFSRIARDVGRPVATISDACRRLADLIDLPIRVRPRGRPRLRP